MIIAAIRLERRNSALVVLRRLERLEGDFDETRKRWPTVVEHEVPIAQRFGQAALGDLVRTIADLALPPKGSVLLVDCTVTGRPALMPFFAAGLRPFPVLLSESGRPHRAHRTWHIPRPDALTSLGLALDQDRIAIDPTCQELARQLEGYRVRPEREDELELALACALAAWWAERRVPSTVEQPRPPRVPIRIKGLGEHTWDEILAMEKGR